MTFGRRLRRRITRASPVIASGSEHGWRTGGIMDQMTSAYDAIGSCVSCQPGTIEGRRDSGGVQVLRHRLDWSRGEEPTTARCERRLSWAIE
jgi:hypothetical protein